jgi:hypothetical protein
VLPEPPSGVEVPKGPKWLVILLFLGTMTVLIGGVVLAGAGFKSLADRFVLPVFLICFGVTIVVGLYVNMRYVGWLMHGGLVSGRPKYASVWQNRRLYLFWSVVAALAGAGMSIFGAVLLFRRI